MSLMFSILLYSTLLVLLREWSPNIINIYWTSFNIPYTIKIVDCSQVTNFTHYSHSFGCHLYSVAVTSEVVWIFFFINLVFSFSSIGHLASTMWIMLLYHFILMVSCCEYGETFIQYLSLYVDT